MVDALLIGGALLLGAFVVIETRVAEPLFQLSLFRIRAFTAGNIAGFAVSVARGGLQFVLIIWLQGIWLPLHGYSYSQTPLWAGIFLLPLTAGFLVSGPLAGTLSDRFGSRGMATAGTVVFGGSFVGLLLLPVDFPYWAFALLIAASGIGSGMFAAPNTSSIMSSRSGPPARRRLGHAGDVPELGYGALHRDLLLAHDRRADGHALDDADQRAAAARRHAERGPPRGLPAAGGLAVRRPARRQPDSAPVGAQRRAVHALDVQPAACSPATPSSRS